jgi:glycosyltransferase involved in cell wall biosynthesis
MPDSTIAKRRDSPAPGARSSAPSIAGSTILQVLPALISGGAERGCIDVAEAIGAAGGTAIVASEGGPMERELQRVGARHMTLPLAAKTPLAIGRNIRRLEALIADHGVDLVHARSRAPAWSAFYAARRTGTPFVTTMHAPYNASGPLKRFYNSVMGRGDRVIAISGFVAVHARAVYGVGPDRLRFVPRGVDLDRFAIDRVSPERVIALARRWRLPEDRPVVLMPGRLSRWKGQIVLIEALGRLRDLSLHCLIVGGDQGRTGYRQELQSRIDRLGLAASIHLVDHCDDMPAAYMLSDVVVHASTDPEGFGRVITEAMALGRPVIATAIGAPPEIVHAGETGWLVPPDDPEALAMAVDRALRIAPAERAAMAEAAIRTIRAGYTKAGMTDGTLAVYAELLATRSR